MNVVFLHAFLMSMSSCKEKVTSRVPVKMLDVKTWRMFAVGVDEHIESILVAIRHDIGIVVIKHGKWPPAPGPASSAVFFLTALSM